jgi:hypothetical protein
MPGVPAGTDEAILNSCTSAVCLSHYTDSMGQRGCAYARAASLKLLCAGTAGRARALVRREIRRGFRRVKVGADIAGIVASPKGASVVLSVGRAWVLFTEAASSDDNPNPLFHGVRQDVIRGARNFTPYLRRSKRVC